MLGSDNFADAPSIVIPNDGDTYISDSTSNTTFTTEPGEPAVSASSARSGWWKYLPVNSGNATFDTQLTTPITSTDSYMAIWTGTALDNLVLSASDDDSGGSGTSRIVDHPVVAGTPYWIQLGGYGLAQMNYVLRIVGPATIGGIVSMVSKRDKLAEDLASAGQPVGSVSDRAHALLKAQVGAGFEASINDYIVNVGPEGPILDKNSLQ